MCRIVSNRRHVCWIIPDQCNICQYHMMIKMRKVLSNYQRWPFVLLLTGCCIITHPIELKGLPLFMAAQLLGTYISHSANK